MNKTDVTTLATFDRTDRWVAVGVGLVAFLCYLRTLAPDLLFADSAEFQALSYTFGITHSTGYPIYLLLGKLFGTLLPFGTFAYRINLLSAVYAAGTLAGIYRMGRFLTASKFGAVLGCLALGTAQTFWSQAVIAEVYTLATLALTWSMVCLWQWFEEPARRSGWLLASLLLLGLGIHTVVELVVPAVGLFILWTLKTKCPPGRAWGRAIGMAIAGGAIGAALFFAAFYASDMLVNPPTSFLNISLIPSRSQWGADSADLDSFFERVYHTVFSLQWGGQFFSGDPGYIWQEWGRYMAALFVHDFNLPLVIIALVGMVVALQRRRMLAGFLLASLITVLFFILNYQVMSKYVFYLASYVLLAAFISAGAAFLLEKAQAWQPGNRVVVGLAAALLVALVIAPIAPSRWEALREGRATFFTDDEYTYPYKDLMEPRYTASAILSSLPQNAMVIMEWRNLYSVIYLANAEQNRTDVVFREACPFPCDGTIPESLVEDINAALAAGRPVITENLYKNSYEHFRVEFAPGNNRYYQYLAK